MSETHSEFYERWSARARPYFAWQFSQLRPHLGRRVADIGCALGSFAPLILGTGAELYLGVEPDADLRARFRERHRDPRARLCAVTDALDPALPAALRAEKIDSAICVNALEHIEDDATALRRVLEGLPAGGRLGLLVPAHPFLYGTLDALDGHYRRYTKASLRTLVSRAGGADILDLYFFNAVAALGWLFKGRVLRARAQTDDNYALMNALLPLVSRAERLVHPPFGLSLVAILRRR